MRAPAPGHSAAMTQPDQTAGGRTPAAPDVDQPDGGTGDAGRTPDNPDNDQPDGGEDA
jgi:hypothetical protein